jgi:hypothetical protein
MKRIWILGCLLIATSLFLFAQNKEPKGKAPFFVGRVKYSTNDGNDCSGVGKDLLKLVAQHLTVQTEAERFVELKNLSLFESPFVFMNGHHDFVLSELEIQNLREYLSRGGFFFASGCCTNPGFPKAWRREFSRIFPNEEVKVLSYDHQIYNCYHKIETLRSLHESKDIRVEALSYQGHPVAVMVEDGLCCAFSMNGKCNQGKGIGAEDGKKLVANIVVYALTH